MWRFPLRRLFCTGGPKREPNTVLYSLLAKTNNLSELISTYKAQLAQFDDKGRTILLQQLSYQDYHKPEVSSLMRQLAGSLYKSMGELSDSNFSTFMRVCYFQTSRHLGDIVNTEVFNNEVEKRMSSLSSLNIRRIILALEKAQPSERTKTLLEKLFAQLVNQQDFASTPSQKLVRLLQTCIETDQKKFVCDLCHPINLKGLEVKSLCFLLRIMCVVDTKLDKLNVTTLILQKMNEEDDYKLKDLVNLIWTLGKYNIGEMSLFAKAINLLKKKLQLKKKEGQESGSLDDLLDVDIHRHYTQKLNPIDCVQILLALKNKDFMDIQLFETVESNFLAQLSSVDRQTLVSYIVGHSDLCIKAIRAVAIDDSVRSKMKIQKIKNYHYSIFSKIFTFVSASNRFQWEDLAEILKHSNKLEIAKRSVKRLAAEMVFVKLRAANTIDKSKEKKLKTLARAAEQFMNKSELQQLLCFIHQKYELSLSKSSDKI